MIATQRLGHEAFTSDNQGPALGVCHADDALSFGGFRLHCVPLLVKGARPLTRSVLTRFSRTLRDAAPHREHRIFRLQALAPLSPRDLRQVERFHQTVKRFLAKQPKATTIAELQAQLDRLVAYYNEIRPHRAKRRRSKRALV